MLDKALKTQSLLEDAVLIWGGSLSIIKKCNIMQKSDEIAWIIGIPCRVSQF